MSVIESGTATTGTFTLLVDDSTGSRVATEHGYVSRELAAAAADVWFMAGYDVTMREVPQV